MSPLLDESIRRGEMTEEEAHGHRSGLRSALTGNAIALTDKGSIEWTDEDAFLLASDGILTLEEEDIAAIITGNCADPGLQSQAAVDDLLDQVELCAPPDQDNCTLILIARANMNGQADAVPNRARRWLNTLFRPNVLTMIMGLGLAGLAGVALMGANGNWDRFKILYDLPGVDTEAARKARL